MFKQLQTLFLKGVLLLMFLFILSFIAEAQVKRNILGDCPLVSDPAGPDKTICPYPGSVQIGLSPETGMNYYWTPFFALSDPFIANPIASPSTSTVYNLTTTGRNIIYNGDFEFGNIGFQTNYNYNTSLLYPGDYVIGNNPSQYNVGNAWCNTPNHTPGEQKMMIIDGKQPFQPTLNNFWQQTVAILPNKTYLLSAWFLSTSWQWNSYLYEPIIQISVNGNIVANNFRLTYNNCNWVNLSVPINVGNSNTALIEMRTMTDASSGSGNDFAVDDITLRCVITDDVIVNVCTPCVTPTVYPSGPIDYYYLYEAGSGKYTFTTTSNGVLQWYVDGQAITGATGQTFNYTFNTNTTSSNIRNVTVNSNGCFSTSTVINLNPYGGCPQSPYPTPPHSPHNNHCWPVGITTPLYYCQSGGSYLQTFDMGPTATYTWSTSNSPSPTYLTVTAQNQYFASVYVANTGSFVTNNVYAKSVLNGYVKVFDYYVNIPGPTRNAYQTCNNGVGVCFAGESGFDNETYTFPGVITSVSNPAYQSSVGTNYLICSGILSSSFQVKFSNPAFVNNFTISYTNNNYSGDCFNETVYMYMAPYPCFAPLQNSDESAQKQLITIFPNPATNQITITSNEAINYIEISDLMNPTLKRIKVNGTKSTIINVSDLNPGIYNCKITTSKGIENQKLIIKR